MIPEYINALLNTWQAVAAITLGSVLAVIITHRLSIDRDRITGIRNRKRAFLAFMESWKYEIGRLRRAASSAGIERNESSFGDMISTFVHESSAIKWDFKKANRVRFETLCAKITGEQFPTIYNPQDHEKVVKSFDEIIAFVEEN